MWIHIQMVGLMGPLGATTEEELIPMPGSVAYLFDRSCIRPEGFESSK